MKNTVLFFVSVLLLMSCTAEGDNPESKAMSKTDGEDSIQLLFDLEMFEAERRLWLEQDLRDYSFHIKFFPNIREGTVIVKDGAFYAFLSDRIITQSEIGNGIFTISEMYDSFYSVVSAKNKGKGNDYRIEYDDAYHFPKLYYAGYYYRSPDGKQMLAYPIIEKSISNFTLNPPELEALSFDREAFDKERRLWLEQGLRDYSYRIRLESKEYIPELGGVKESYWRGVKVVIKDGALFSFTNWDRDSYMNENNPDYPPPPELEKWVTSLSEIYSHIDNDSQDNAGLNLGSPWHTEMKVWRERFEGHPDSIAYTYRDYRCLLPQQEPSEEGELFGLYKSFELYIGRLKPLE
jgi:hypothetical protein